MTGGRALENAVGELVVTEPMPSMPLYFWNDADGRELDDELTARLRAALRSALSPRHLPDRIIAAAMPAH